MMILRVIGAVCLIAASACAWAGAFTNFWYSISTSSVNSNFGLFKTCSGGNCIDFKFQDNPQCTSRSGSELQTRIQAVTGLAISSGLIALIGCVAAGVSIALSNKFVLPLAVFLSVLCAACAGSGIALYVYTMENWYFCDQTYCSLYSTIPSCSSNFDYSFFLVAGTTGLAVIALILLLVAFCTGNAAPEPETEMREPYDAGRRDTNHHQYHEQQQQRQTNATRETTYDSPPTSNTVPLPPEGDWEYDEGSGLYWSQQEYLYLDTVTNQYFDPKSGQWYDPASQQWYHKD